MPKHKSMLVSCAIEVATRGRKCHHSRDHFISAGEQCLVVKEQLASKNYCLRCASVMLREALVDIESIATQLNLPIEQPKKPAPV